MFETVDQRPVATRRLAEHRPGTRVTIDPEPCFEGRNHLLEDEVLPAAEHR